MSAKIRLACAALVGATLIPAAATFAAAPVANGIKLSPRVSNGRPASTLNMNTNNATTNGTILIDDQGIGGAAGTNRHDAYVSTDGGATARTLKIFEGFNIEGRFTLTAGSNTPRKEAGFRIIGNPTGTGLFIINSDAGEIVAFGGGMPFKSFGNNGGGNGYTPGQTILMGLNYVPGANGGQGTLEYYIDRDVNSAAGFETSGPLPITNLEGGPVNYQLAIYGQYGANTTNAADFGTLNVSNLNVTLTPEPATLASLVVGGLMLRRRRA